MTKGSKAGYVPDFATTIGTGNLSTATRLEQKTGTGPTIVSTGSSITGRRAKGPTSRGFVDPFTLHRKATPYTRIIRRGDHTGAFEWTNRLLNGTEVTYKMSNAFQGLGFSMTDNLGKFSNLNVVVSQSIVARAKAEAYDNLLKQKISLGQAAAELGETLYWFASLVRRLAEALAIVRDALRGRFSRAAAHTRLFGNPNRIYPNGRVRRNRWKDVAGDPRAVRYRQEQYRHWWSSEAYERWSKREQRKFRKSRSKRSPSTAASSAWLEYQYALMPLIYDVYGALEVLKEGLRQDNFLFSVQRTITGNVDPGAFLTSSAGPFMVTGEVQESCRVVYWGRIRMTLASALAELGLNNPWLIAWELVPFSFVVDWVLPLGKILSSFTAPVGVTFVDGYQTELISGTIHGVLHSSGSGYRISGKLPEATVKILGMQRDIYLTWPYVEPYIKSPFSHTHVTSALALLKQFTK